MFKQVVSYFLFRLSVYPTGTVDFIKIICDSPPPSTFNIFSIESSIDFVLKKFVVGS